MRLRPPDGLAFFFVATILILGHASTLRADTVTVGDPANPAGLPAAIRQAHAHGAADITIAPGTYDIPSINHQDTILLDHWNGTTIHATGATLIFEELDHRPVHLVHCTNVTWDGGTLRFARPAFSQGRITGLRSDSQGDSCLLQIDAGYPTNFDPVQTTYNIVDQNTRVLKVNTGDWSPQSADSLGHGLFKLHYPPGRGGGFAVNDWLVCRAPAGNQIVHLDNSEGCTIENVTLQNAGFAAFFETGGGGGNHYLRDKLQPGPRPPGATEDQLVGCGADGFHSTQTETGPDIEDCAYRGVLLDDCIAIHGSFARVVKADGPTITVRDFYPVPRVGDPIRIADMAGFYAEAVCTKVAPGPDDLLQVTLDRSLSVPIDHSQDAEPKKGTKAWDPDFCGQGYKILRCRIGDTRSRGILAKADHGVIEGCTIYGCGMSAISIGPEFWWGEAGYCQNVAVTDNTLTACNKQNGDQAAIWIHGDGAIGNKNIRIAHNTLDTCYGPYMIRIDWAAGVRIEGNKIMHPFDLKLDQPGHAIWLTHSRNVTVRNNSLSDQGPSPGDALGLDPSVNPADVQRPGP